AEDLEQSWEDLAVADPRTGLRAVRALAADPEKAMALLRARLVPARAVDPRRLALLVERCRGTSDQEWETARAELQGLGEQAEAFLRQAVAAEPAGEGARRLEELRTAMQHAGPAPETLRSMR